VIFCLLQHLCSLAGRKLAAAAFALARAFLLQRCSYVHVSAARWLLLQYLHLLFSTAVYCTTAACLQVADLRAAYSLVLQAVQSNAKLVAWHRCRLQNAPVVATAAALAMAEQQGGQEIDADSIITAQVGCLCCVLMLCIEHDRRC
jgi:hypothetical protein